MKLFWTATLTLILIQSFGQNSRLIIGKGYSAQEDSTSKNVYISIENDLDSTLKNITLTHGRQRILTIRTLKGNQKKCYSFSKNELRGDRTFILQCGQLADTLQATDDISYNIHKLELSNHVTLLSKKAKRKIEKMKAREEENDEDKYFLPSTCNYRQRKL